MGLKEQVVKDIIRECIEPLLELKKGFEKQENRVDEIKEKLPTEKYPSVNAVINFVKNKITDFSNNLSTVYVKLLDFDVYKKDVKTSFENLEKGVADTYATKTVVDDLKTNTEVTRTATGNAITIESSQAPLQNLKLFGKTEQNGTPTPDAPVPLVSVGDSGSFELGVYGKNLLNVSSEITRTTAGFCFENVKCSLKANRTYTISFICSITLTNGVQFAYTTITNKGINLKALSPTANTRISQTFTPTEDVENVRLYLNANSGGTISNFMLEEGTEATPYEPCNKQTLTMPYTLRSVGDIKDEVDFNSGANIQNLRLHTITTVSSVEELTNCLRVRIFLYDTPKQSQSLCVHLPFLEDYYSDTEHFYCATHNNTAYLFINKSRVSAYDKNTVQAWIVEQGIKILYATSTPIETPLTETELNAYRHLMTNKGKNTILSEAEAEVDYYINKPNAQAIGNLHSQVNEDYFKLQQAIISLGGN